MKKLIFMIFMVLFLYGNAFAAVLSKSFTATGEGPSIAVKVGDSFDYAVSGTFVGTVKLQRSTNYFTWTTVATATTAATGTVIAASDNANQVNYRFFCDAFTSGTIVTTLTEDTGYMVPVQEFKNKNGQTIAYTTEKGMVVQDLTVTGTATGTGGGAVTPGGTSPQVQFNNSTVLDGIPGSGADSNGNIGFGTSGPTSKLSVVGTAGIGTGGIDLFKVTTGRIGVGTIAPLSTLEIMKTGTDKLLSISSGPGGNGDFFTVDNGSGNVGIGTGLPLPLISGLVNKVTVWGSSTATYAASANQPVSVNIVNASTTTNNMGQLVFNTLDTAGTVQSGGRISNVFTSHGVGTAGSDLVFGTTNGGILYETMRLLNNGSGGYVGIGSTAPTGKLEVKGQGTTTGVGFRTRDSAGAIKTTFLDSGNVGIGSSSPAQLLDVNGTIQAAVFIGTGAGISSTVGNLGVGTATVPGTLVVGASPSHATLGACWCSTGAIGYCTGVIGTCSACTCL